VITSSKATLTTPLLFDHGDKGECGSSLDWCGRVLEGIRGKRLGEVIGKRIFQPLGVEDITFSMTPSMRSCLAATYAAQRAQAAA
jgi:methyl acetate hydrolase